MDNAINLYCNDAVIAAHVLNPVNHVNLVAEFAESSESKDQMQHATAKVILTILKRYADVGKN